MELVDGRVLRRRESEMDVLRRDAGDKREGAALPSEVRKVGPGVPQPESGVRRDALVEPLRRVDVGDANPEMIDAVPQIVVVHRLDAVPVGVE